jgi:hypothetical protein
VNGDRAYSAEIDALRKKCLHLEHENARLRSLLADYGIASEAVAKQTHRPAEPTPNGLKLSTAEKIALFRSSSAVERTCTRRDGTVRTAAPATRRERNVTGTPITRRSRRIENVSIGRLARVFH